MSIASEITRLGSLRDTIRNKLISAGIISNASAKLSECATAINGMTVNSKVSKVLNTSTTSVAIPKGYHKEAGTVSISTQEKTQAVTSGTVTVSPDSGKVLKKVTVNGPTSYADTTQFASAITQDDENTYFGVPNAGYYNTGSKIAAKNSNLGGLKIPHYQMYGDSVRGFSNLLLDVSNAKTVTISEAIRTGNACGTMRIYVGNTLVSSPSTATGYTQQCYYLSDYTEKGTYESNTTNISIDVSKYNYIELMVITRDSANTAGAHCGWWLKNIECK